MIGAALTAAAVPLWMHLSLGRRPWAFNEARLLVLDGTANPDIMHQFVPTLAAGQEIQVKRNARVVQVSDRTFWKGSLIERTPTADGKGRAEPTARLLEAGDFIERSARAGKTVVVTNPMPVSSAVRAISRSAAIIAECKPSLSPSRASARMPSRVAVGPRVGR